MVIWCFWEDFTVNPIVAYLLRIRAEMNSGALLIPYVFYHPGLLNTMADDSSRHFDFPENNSLFFFLSKYRPS